MDAVNEYGFFACDAVIPEAFYDPFAVFGQGVLFIFGTLSYVYMETGVPSLHGSDAFFKREV